MATVLAFSGFGDDPMKFYNTDGTAHAQPGSAPVECGAGCDGIVRLTTNKIAVIGGNTPNFGSSGVGLFNSDWTVVGDLGTGPTGQPNRSSARDDSGRFYGLGEGLLRTLIYRYDASGYLAQFDIGSFLTRSGHAIGVNGAGTIAYYVVGSGAARDTVYAWDLVGDTDLGAFKTRTGYTVLNNALAALTSGDVIIGWDKTGNDGILERYNAAGSLQQTYTMAGTHCAPIQIARALTDTTFWASYYNSATSTSSGCDVAEFTTSGGAVATGPWSPDDGSFEFDGSFTVVDMGDPPFMSIDGVEYAPKMETLSIMKFAGSASRCVFDIVSVDGSFRPPIDGEVIITELTGERIFAGLIDETNERGLGDVSATGIITSVACASYMVYADRRVNVTETFVSQDLATTVESLRSTYLDVYGVTLDPAQVTGPTLDAVGYSSQTLRSVFDDLAARAGGYTWLINDRKVLSFYLPAASAAPYDITTANAKAISPVRVRRTSYGYANRVIVKYGPSGVSRVTFYFEGDGILDTFTLPMLINGPLPYGAGDAAVGEAVVVGPLGPGLTESLGGPTAGLQWQYDPSVPTAPTIFRPAGAVPNGNVFSVSYNAEFPATVTAEDGSAATNPRELVFLRPDITDPTVAQALADELLAITLVAGVEVTYQTAETGLEPGMTQTIDLAGRGIASGTYTATQVETRNTTGNLLKRFVTASSGSTARPELLEIARYAQWAGTA